MTRLANISGKDAVKAFQKAGWQVIGQVGSHIVLYSTLRRPFSFRGRDERHSLKNIFLRTFSEK